MRLGKPIVRKWLRLSSLLVAAWAWDSWTDNWRIQLEREMRLTGIHWGGNHAGTRAVFTPIRQVEWELGIQEEDFVAP